MKRSFEQTSSFSVNKKHHTDEEVEIALCLEKLQTTDSDIIELICADDNPIVVYWKDLERCCTPVLRRFMGKSEGFSEPEKNEKGQLTFLKTFGIDSREFIKCLTFVKSGYISDFDMLMTTMTILGGHDKLDALAEQHQQYNTERIQKSKIFNPSCPMEDIANNGEGIYIWKPGPCTVNSEKGWSATITIETTPHLFWWRKLNK
tara:strand:+ start:618 stop:1229 length:612 start_codon:yes stop_codon:yes gene_type:complete